jgi:hypothetical protein
MRLLSLVMLAVSAMWPVILRAAPASQPALADQRAKLLSAAAGANSFELTLEYHGDQDKPFYGLTLSLQKVAGDDPFHPGVTITPKQAGKIIAQLSADGFLPRAADAQNEKAAQPQRPAGPCYTLRVACDDKAGRHEYREDLGWDLAMLKRLDGVRGVLDEDAAAKPMDTLLGRLTGQRKRWEREEGDIAATPRTLRSFKGWELYIWQGDGNDGQTYYSLMQGTNDLKSDERIAKAAVKGLEAIKGKLSELETGQTVTICGRRHGDAASGELSAPVEAYCRKMALKAQLQ